MSDVTGKSPAREMRDIHVRFWAAARAAAGRSEVTLPHEGVRTLADLTARLTAPPEGTRLRPVLSVCAVLVDDRPLGRRDPATVLLAPGTRVEFLPPFAGG